MNIYEEKQLLDFLVSTNRFVAPFEDVKPSLFSTGIFQSVFIDGKHLVMLKRDYALFIESIKPICFDDVGEKEAFTDRISICVDRNSYPIAKTRTAISLMKKHFIKLKEKKK